MQFSFHDWRFCLGRRCLTVPASRCSFYPQQTFFICLLTAEETFSISNVHMMYRTHVRDEKCLFKKSIPMLRGKILDVLNLDWGRLSDVTEKKKKRKNWNDGPRGHFITQTGRPGDPQPPGYISPRGAIRHQRVRGRKIHQNSLCSVRYTKEPLRIRDGRCVYSCLH